MLKTAAAAVKQIGASSLHITFLTAEEWRAAGEAGYLQRTGQQFHWENRGYKSFDEFLGELSSAKRKNLRKERASVREAGVTFDWLTGADITEAHWDQFFAFLHGHRRTQMGHALSDPRFLFAPGRKPVTPDPAGDGEIGRAVHRRRPQPVRRRHTVWTQLGGIEYIPFLHFETCYYQAIDFAIARGLKKVEAGAQGEHKLLRGYLPVETYSAHLIAHKGLARAVDDFLEAERAAVAENMAELARHAPFKKEN